MRKLAWLAVAAIAVIGVGTANAQQTPRKGGALRMTAPYAASFGSLDPHVTPRAQDDIVGKALQRSLYNWNTAANKLELELAKSVSVSADGLTYTYKLRDDAFFHNGRKMTADDVIFSFERQMDAENPYNQYVEGASWEYFNGMSMPDLIESIEKVDDMTVKFKLKRAEAPFVANLAMDFASIMSKEYADKLAESGAMSDLNQKPVGTGPYQFVAYQPDAVIRYKANPDYWNGKEAIDDLVFDDDF